MTRIEKSFGAQFGRVRWFVFGFFVLALIGIGSLFVLRATSLRGLPDIGDPFDMTQYAKVEIPTDQNAYTFYIRAHEQLDQKIPQDMPSTFVDWAQVDASHRNYLELNRKALQIWFEGTKRNHAIYIQPGVLNFETMLPAVQSLRTFCRLANLEACRLEHDGDMDNAWAWLRANLRCGRHCGKDGVVIERLVGVAIYAVASRQAMQWSDNPRVNAKQLRQALDDVIAIDAMTPTIAETIRAEYYTLINSIGNPELRNRLYQSQYPRPEAGISTLLKDRVTTTFGVLVHEPERSRRVIRLVVANWLTGAKLTAIEGSQRLTKVGDLTIYNPAASEIPPMPSEELGRWYQSTLYAKTFLSNWASINRALVRDEQARGALIVHLAEQLYSREHGKLPETVNQLVGPYLKSLPNGYTPPSDTPTKGGTAQ